MENIFTMSGDLLVILVLLTHISGSFLTSTMPENNVTVCQTSPNVMSWRVEDFPNPQTDISADYCGRGCRKSRLCDPGHILTTNQADALDRQIDEIRSFSSCRCRTCNSGSDGLIISIALVQAINKEAGNGTHTLKRKARDFANYLKDTTWNYSRCENDIVIFLSKEQKLIQIVRGNTTKETLDERCLTKIQDKAEILLSEGNVSRTLDYLLTRLGEVFKHQTCDPPQPASSVNTSIIAIAVTLGVLVLVMVVSMFLHRQGKCEKEQTYSIDLPPITINVRKPHKHHQKKSNRKSYNSSDDELTPVNLDHENGAK